MKKYSFSDFEHPVAYLDVYTADPELQNIVSTDEGEDWIMHFLTPNFFWYWHWN
jgi:hypothetical protein